MVVHRWAAADDHWPAPVADGVATDLFAPRSTFPAFLAAHTLLATAGVRVARLWAVDPGGGLLADPCAVVEDLPGGTLEDLLANDPPAGRQALTALDTDLRIMHALDRDRPGRPDHPLPRPLSCVDLARRRALDDLTAAAARRPEVAAVADRLAERIDELAAAAPERDDHRLVHGELGPDHVLLSADGEPVLIDVEDAMYVDLELDHVFLRHRFGPRYAALQRDDLDPARIGLYRLGMHLSLVAGPLLLDGSLPTERHAGMLAIVAENLTHTLRLLER